MPGWAGLAEALLTQQGQFRKPTGINNRIGFTAKSTEKLAFCELLEQLSHSASLARALHAARALPLPRYEAADWQVLESLLQVLVRAASELELLFAQTRQTDYAGLAAAALRGLGDEAQGITDLGLYLDQRIQHILVDEFQDTNWSQLHLLEKLTAGWETDDGRSLFLVGDPMQSIYRFREAEVGLFIRCRDHGIGLVALEYARLERNFRSRSEIVHWVNDHLGPIFPEHEDISAGAVAYAPSEPARAEGGAVELQAWADATAEAEGVAALVSNAIASQGPEYKIAVLVKARSHLQALLAALGEHEIPFRAVKLDPLLSQMVIQDLLAITRVILLPSDVSAWLAMLRAPTCGLTLQQLHALAGDGRSLFAADALQRLDPDGRERADKVFSAIADAQSQWRRRSIAELVAGVWTRLGGPQCCTQPRTELQDAQRYSKRLIKPKHPA